MSEPGFNLDELAAQVRGEVGSVRIVYENFFNDTFSDQTLGIGRGRLQVPVGTLSASEAQGTVRDVFRHANIVSRLQQVADQLRSKGYPTPEQYVIGITDVEGNVRIAPNDMETVLNEPVQSGDLISILGKISGRN